MRQVGTQIDCLGRVVPTADDFGVTHQGVVVFQPCHMQVGGGNARCARKQIRCIELAHCAATEFHIVDIKCLEDVVEVDVVERHAQLIVGVFRHLTAYFYKLLVAVGKDVSHLYHIVVGIDVAAVNAPHRVVDHNLCGVDIDIGFKFAIVVPLQ